MTDSCATCRFWQRLHTAAYDSAKRAAAVKTDMGQCRRRAPDRDGWPSTWEWTWCGEFEAVPNPPSPAAEAFVAAVQDAAARLRGEVR